MKRYCQTLDLVGDDRMIENYIDAHRHVWPEIQEGIRSVGILDMQIYRLERRVFMIMDTTDDFDFVKDNARLATLPRQAEWEAYVARFQGCDPSMTSTQKCKSGQMNMLPRAQDGRFRSREAFDGHKSIVS